MYHIVYRNAEVVDGTRSPKFKADAAISADRISTVEASPNWGWPITAAYNQEWLLTLCCSTRRQS